MTAETAAAAPGGPSLRERREREPRTGPAALQKGARVGRYEIVDELGAGGMGVVYRARDAELERDVALKLVTADAIEGESHGRARLLREAQALAQLAHPNVTAIYDVGRFEGGVFLAMELVEGERLDDWSKSARRSWQEVLPVFVAAGRGLEAAHVAGLVHRDFKPSNVMLGADGRVRVLDFGLARAAGDSLEISASSLSERERSVDRAPGVPALGSRDDFSVSSSISSAGSLLVSQVTQLGAIIGTPPYMAPEQHQGAVGDARSDQFSFCVSLYQALYGERPFGGGNRHQLRDEIIAGRVRLAPAGANVPAWIRKILLRGLAVDPDKRWPSMTSLLVALGRDPMTRWRRVAAGAGIAALVGVAAFGLLRGAEQVQPCTAAASEAGGVWNSARRSALRTAFLATGKPYANDAYRTAEQGLDAYTKAWVAMHSATCQATHVQRVQSDELLDLRMECLAQHLDGMRAQIDVFAGADAAVVERAAQAVQALPTLTECADVEALRASVRPPAAADTRAEVDELRRELATVRALLESGRYPDALVQARPLVARAKALAYRPIEAEALFYLGRLQEVTGDYPAAAMTLREAGAAAEAGHHDLFAARAWTLLVWVVGGRQGKFAEAYQLADEAKAKIERAGSDQILLADFEGKLGLIYMDEGKYDDALTYATRSLALREKLLAPNDIVIAGALSGVADVHTSQGKFVEAIAEYRRALAIYEAALGVEHPALVSTLTNLATSLRAHGSYDEAIVHLLRAQQIAEKALGPDHATLGTIFLNLASIERSQRKLDLAVAHYERARAIFTRALGADHPNVGTVHYYLGGIKLEQGHPAEALVEHRRTLAIWEKALGADHPSLSAALVGIADALLAQGDAAGALSNYLRAVALLEKAVGADHPDLAEFLTGVGRAQLALAAPRRALAPLERALALRTKNPGDPLELARTEFLLAQALAAAGTDAGRARTLAGHARGAYAANPSTAREAAAIDAWLATAP